MASSGNVPCKTDNLSSVTFITKILTKQGNPFTTWKASFMVQYMQWGNCLGTRVYWNWDEVLHDKYTELHIWFHIHLFAGSYTTAPSQRLWKCASSQLLMKIYHKRCIHFPTWNHYGHIFNATIWIHSSGDHIQKQNYYLWHIRGKTCFWTALTV